MILPVTVPIKTLDRQIVRFSSTGCEDNLIAVTTDTFGDDLSSFFQDLP
jgi:hypothetical protein